ncbi:MAG: triose-phosphate isomerase [Clostridia bacterium]|nr:triose-phosphate isomerase [Clostridia bacterium]
MRKYVIAGNWKMNNTPAQTKELINEMKPLVAGASCEVVLCVPFVDIAAAVEAAKGSDIKIGAENIHWAESGAFTGEISGDMLKAAGAEYVIIGHSERRQYFGETDDTVNARLKAAIAAGLTPIVCVGETLEQREKNITVETVAMQTKIAFRDISTADAKNTVIAYEPVWAIGTGKTATDEQADEVNGAIRNVIAEIYGKDVADSIVIQYGGSMNAKNAEGLLAKEHIDGGLIGGASLKAQDFAVIVNAAK